MRAQARAKCSRVYSAGPRTGVFTDGSCEGNPGPGGWGFVWVEHDVIRAERLRPRPGDDQQPHGALGR